MPRENPDYEDLYHYDDLDDEEIHELLRQELEEYPDLDPDLLDVQVDDGFVTIAGRVGTEQELQEIEHVLTDVLGITDFSNELVVDELVRAEYSAAADEAITEDTEVDAQLGGEGERTESSADHLLEDVATELYGTHDLHEAIEEGKSYRAPDRPIQEGIWSKENH